MNTDVMDEAIKRIEASPDKWNQEVYRCQTGMCFAGHVAFAAGARWAEPFAPGEYDFNDIDVITPDGERMAVDEFATVTMGIAGRYWENIDAYTPYRFPVSDLLFSPFNSLDALRDYVSQIKEHGTIKKLYGPV